MLFVPKIPMLNSQNSACYARIMPNYAILCRLVISPKVMPAYFGRPNLVGVVAAPRGDDGVGPHLALGPAGMCRFYIWHDRHNWA